MAEVYEKPIKLWAACYLEKSCPRSRIEVRPTALPRYHAHTHWTLAPPPLAQAATRHTLMTCHYGRQSIFNTVTLTLTYDLDFQSRVSYSHDPNSSSSQVIRSRRQSEDKRTDGRTDAADWITFPAHAVDNNRLELTTIFIRSKMQTIIKYNDRLKTEIEKNKTT